MLRSCPGPVGQVRNMYMKKINCKLTSQFNYFCLKYGTNKKVNDPNDAPNLQKLVNFKGVIFIFNQTSTMDIFFRTCPTLPYIT